MSTATSARAFAVILALFAGPNAMAQTRPIEAPDGWPESPLSAKSGAFGVILVPTLDPDGLMAEWAKPTPGVHIKTTRQTTMGRPLSIFINYRNCKPDARGLCNVTAEWRLQKPGGKPAVVATSRVNVGSTPPRPGILGISGEAPAFEFQPPDPAGLYVIHARITDRVAGITLDTRADITVTP